MILNQHQDTFLCLEVQQLAGGVKNKPVQHYQLLRQNTQLYVVLHKKPVG